MPEIARFYGILIKIFFRNEHNQPHIHAIYGEYNGVIEKMIEGDLPNKALKMVQEWAAQYKDELQSMWDEKKLIKLPPLD